MRLSALIVRIRRRSLPTTFRWKNRPAGRASSTSIRMPCTRSTSTTRETERPDVTFDFKFNTTIANPNTFLTHLGTAGQGGGDAVISSLDDADFNVKQTYSVSMTGGSLDTPIRKVPEAEGPEVLGSNLVVPPYNIGPGATPNYRVLASQAVYNLPGGIQVFAGPRDDPFFVDLGAVFDRLELRPLGIFGDPRGRDSARRFQRAQHLSAGSDRDVDLGRTEAGESDGKECCRRNLGRSQPPADFHSAQRRHAWIRTGKWFRCRGSAIRS